MIVKLPALHMAMIKSSFNDQEDNNDRNNSGSKRKIDE